MSKNLFRRDLICHGVVVSSFAWGVETAVRYGDLDSLAREFNGEESRDVKVRPSRARFLFYMLEPIRDLPVHDTMKSLR